MSYVRSMRSGVIIRACSLPLVETFILSASQLLFVVCLPCVGLWVSILQVVCLSPCNNAVHLYIHLAHVTNEQAEGQTFEIMSSHRVTEPQTKIAVLEPRSRTDSPHWGGYAFKKKHLGNEAWQANSALPEFSITVCFHCFCFHLK